MQLSSGPDERYIRSSPSWTCDHAVAQAPLYVVYSLIALFGAVYVGIIGGMLVKYDRLCKDNYLRFVLAFNTALSTLDALSDLLFLLTAVFANQFIFILCALIYLVHGCVIIARDFWTRGTSAPENRDGRGRTSAAT